MKKEKEINNELFEIRNRDRESLRERKKNEKESQYYEIEKNEIEREQNRKKKFIFFLLLES